MIIFNCLEWVMNFFIFSMSCLFISISVLTVMMIIAITTEWFNRKIKKIKKEK